MSDKAQPVVTLTYTDRYEAMRALQVDDYVMALETIRRALLTESKNKDHSPETTAVIESLWTAYQDALAGLPKWS